MKVPLKKTLSILITNFFIKENISIKIYSQFNNKASFIIKNFKLNYIRLCAKLCFFSKNSFFFKLKYPTYLLVSSTGIVDMNKRENPRLVYVLFQFYKYVTFNNKAERFFDLSFLNYYVKVLTVYSNKRSMFIYSYIKKRKK